MNTSEPQSQSTPYNQIIDSECSFNELGRSLSSLLSCREMRQLPTSSSSTLVSNSFSSGSSSESATLSSSIWKLRLCLPFFDLSEYLDPSLLVSIRMPVGAASETAQIVFDSHHSCWDCSSHYHHTPAGALSESSVPVWSEVIVFSCSSSTSSSSALVESGTAVKGSMSGSGSFVP